MTDLPPDLQVNDPELADLFAAELRRPGPRPGTDARVKAAVLASVAAAATVAAIGSGAAAATSLSTSGAGAASGAVAVNAGAMSAGAVAGAGSGLGALAGVAAIAKPAGLIAAAVVATAGGGLFVANHQVESDRMEAPSAHVIVEPQKAPTPPPGLVLEPRRPAPMPTTTMPTPTLLTTTLPTTKKQKVEPSVSAGGVDVLAPVVIETPAERTARLAAERVFIAQARAALSNGDTGGALVALEAHKTEHHNGALAEEREALLILALARGGRADEARARAVTFSAHWPKSLFAQAVSDAVGGR